ncbi:hypothetical protein EI94DRAFT_1818369 [Lactarius quietus]|nr:hypothetical protein EI94DRAFT_1818369 [Lactarius quietus]
MPRIAEDPNWALCPNFEGPQWEFLRQSMIAAHQGDQPLTSEEAALQMKGAWARENDLSIVAWNAQLQQDQEEEDERNRATRDEEDALHAPQEREAEELRREAEKKKPKLCIFDRARAGPEWIEPRPAQYALNKLDNLEYVELDYFMMKGCKEAEIDTSGAVDDDALGLAQHGDAITLRPLAAQRPSRRVRSDEDLSWEEMLDTKNMMLQFMEMSGLWPALHAEAISGFFLNLELHPRKQKPNGKRTLLLYQSRVRRHWFDALKCNDGYNIEIIQEEHLRSTADEVNELIRNQECVARDRGIVEQTTSRRAVACMNTGKIAKITQKHTNG